MSNKPKIIIANIPQDSLESALRYVFNVISASDRAFFL